MRYSRFVFLPLCVGLLYAPTASAKFMSDIVNSTKYETTASGSMMTHTSETPIMQTQDTSMTRAAFTAMVVDHLYGSAEIDHCYWDISSTRTPTFTLLYSDVKTTSPYAKELCIALRDGLARGYSDGSFKPDATISFAEASKIISRAYVLDPYADTNVTGPWYGPYAFALSTRNAIPMSVTTFQHSVTASETNDILERLSSNITWRTSQTYGDLVKMSMPPAVKKLTPHASMQTSGRTPLKQSSGSADSSSSSSAQSSSKTPWYKFF